MTFTPSEPSKMPIRLKLPQKSCLVRELRQLMQLTQVQFAAELGVAYETINRWENGHMQPSALALRQLRYLLERLNESPLQELQNSSEMLLNQYFMGERRAQ